VTANTPGTGISNATPLLSAQEIVSSLTVTWSFFPCSITREGLLV
jgi:hypothetical protein